jgi:hypothetical protein
MVVAWRTYGALAPALTLAGIDRDADGGTVHSVSREQYLRCRIRARKIGEASMKYHHLGIPTREPRAGETYLERFKLYCTDHEDNPFGIQWMRYEPDCPLPEVVRTVPHVAFEVDDLDRALVGREVLIEPNSPSPGVRVAFVLCNGAPVELLQYVDD